MLTAFKKLVGTTGGEGGSSVPPRTPSGMQAMEQSLQKRFARGVQYNMKIVIKGDRNVGKSCLLLRLQGLPFKEEYLPSDEIQVASIQWSYKATDDVVKVEVWDVVDRGKKKRPPVSRGLKLDNHSATPPGAAAVPEEAALDAEFIDVYKGTNGVLMMLDITKQWTFDYVQRELPKVPANIPVLVLANHLDMKHHRNITEDQVKFYVESVERPPGSAQIRYAESSLRNGFGLKFLYKWFNLPFLQLQRESLLRQLERNGQETGATTQELDMLQESEEQNYELFVETLNNRRRQMAEQLSSASKPPSQVVPNGLPSSATNCALASLGEASQPQAARSISVPSSLGAAGGPSVLAGGQLQAATQGPGTPTKQAIMSRLFNKKEAMVVKADVHAPPPVSPVHNVDDFVPDGDASFHSFLEDADTTAPTQEEESTSDDDSSAGGNPLVKGFQDDVDPEDVRPAPSPGGHQEFLCTTAAGAPEPLEESCLSREEISREDPDGTSSPAAPSEPAYWNMPSEDLSFLEKRYTGSQRGSAWKLGAPVLAGDTPEDDTPVSKHKKHKHKKADDTERRLRKDRAKEKSSKDKDVSGDKGDGKKSHRKQRKLVEESSSDAERLEAFLGAADDAGVERAVEAYESL